MYKMLDDDDVWIVKTTWRLDKSSESWDADDDNVDLNGCIVAERIDGMLMVTCGPSWLCDVCMNHLCYGMLMMTVSPSPLHRPTHTDLHTQTCT